MTHAGSEKTKFILHDAGNAEKKAIIFCATKIICHTPLHVSAKKGCGLRDWLLVASNEWFLETASDTGTAAETVG